MYLQFLYKGSLLKKIGIVSLYYGNSNYGGQLQAFALPFVLKKMGANAEQICFDRQIDELKTKCVKLKEAPISGFPRAFASLCKYMGVSLGTKLVDSSLKNDIGLRKQAFSRFEQFIPHSDIIYKDDTINKTASVYDAFVCGSDVIWNAGVNPRISALGFVPDDRPKVAYAPSLGVGDIPSWWFDSYKDALARLTAISVREESIADELRALMPNFEICVAADPTLLLSAKEWQDVCRPQETKRYVFCYLLGDSKKQRIKAHDAAKALNLPLMTFPHITNNHFRLCDYNFGDIQKYDADALDFISLIRESEFVITDSFHAVVFSTIFHKPFIALDRINGNESKMGGRVRNYLKTIGLTAHLASNDHDTWSSYIDQKDFSTADDRIKIMRNCSLDYLQKALEL